MAIIRLEGDAKEIYIKNLLLSTKSLIKNIRNDDTLKKTEWDSFVYEEIVVILENWIYPLFYLLQKSYENVEESEKNFGIYSEIVLSNGGFPEFFSYRQLLEDKINAEQKIVQILENENISSKDELAKKWVNLANEINKNDRNYFLKVIPDEYRALEFYEKLKTVKIFDTNNPMNRLSVRSSGEKKILSWFNYTLGFGIWNIYIAKLFEKESKSFLNLRSEKIFSIKNKKRHIDDNFKKFLENHISSGAFFLAKEMDKTFPNIYPARITNFQFGPNFVEGIKSGNMDFSKLFKNNESFLTAHREDIVNSGKNKDNITPGKYLWKADKITEEIFGICSKELEKPLKENLKVPNMRFYII